MLDCIVIMLNAKTDFPLFLITAQDKITHISFQPFLIFLKGNRQRIFRAFRHARFEPQYGFHCCLGRNLQEFFRFTRHGIPRFFICRQAFISKDFHAGLIG